MKKKITVLFLLLFLANQDLFCQDTVFNTNNRSWRNITMLSGGLGMHFTKERNYEHNKGLAFAEIISIKGGSKSLAGIGFGAKVYEVYTNDTISIRSFVPIYVYIPILMSKPTLKEFSVYNRPKRKSLLYLFAGTSFWSISQIKDYQNYGIGYTLTVDISYFDPEYSDKKSFRTNFLYGTMAFSLNAGLLVYQEKDVDRKNEMFYFRVTIDWGLGTEY